MTDEELRESARNNYAAQMEMLGYQTDGNPKDMVEVVRCKDCRKNMMCEITIHKPRDWYCADGERR